MLIQLTHAELKFPLFIESSEVVSVMPVSIEPVTQDESRTVAGAIVHLRHAPSVMVDEQPQEVAQKIERQLGEVLTARKKQPGPSDAKIKFCELIDNIDVLSDVVELEVSFTEDSPIDKALKRIRELLAELEPRD